MIAGKHSSKCPRGTSESLTASCIESQKPPRIYNVAPSQVRAIGHSLRRIGDDPFGGGRLLLTAAGRQAAVIEKMSNEAEVERVAARHAEIQEARVGWLRSLEPTREVLRKVEEWKEERAAEKAEEAEEAENEAEK